MTSKHFLLRYVSPGMYLPPVKSLRFTEYGSEASDGDSPPWSGAISVVAPQAAIVAPPGRPCTEVITSNKAEMHNANLKAYLQRNLK